MKPLLAVIDERTVDHDMYPRNALNSNEISNLQKENQNLRQEVSDLKTLLEATIGHSDGLEADLLRKIDETVKESEKKFRLITETLPVAITITEQSDGSIIYANEAASVLFGLPVESLLNCKATDFYNPTKRPELLDIVSKQGFIRNKELKGYNAQKKPWWVELSLKSLVFEGRSCFLGIFHDITKRKMLEEQLHQSQKMEAIGTLAGGIAHDFNNILLAVFGYTELSLSLVEEGTALHRNLDNILIAGDRAKHLVHQILTFSRRTEQEFKPIQVRPIVKEALKLIRASLPSTITISMNIQSTSIILGDPTQIHQVLMNLCTNAGHAIRNEGGILKVELLDERLDEKFTSSHLDLKPGTYLKLAVSDTGPGIPAEIESRIFEPFFTTKDNGKGSGLGLSVVHGIVKNHRGTVTVCSKPDEGSTFNVYLPSTQLKEKPRRILPITSYAGTESILYVDDDHAIVEMGKQILDTMGYKVKAATGSLEALSLFRSKAEQFDLVISDLTMPDMTGDTLAMEMMKIKPDIPVIICTGGTANMEDFEIQRTGIKAVVMKPFTLEDIHKLIRRVLDD